MDNILICTLCGKEVPRRGPNHKYCKTCAKIVAEEQRHRCDERKRMQEAKKKEAEPATGDTPEMIQICLSCTRKKCNDCLKQYRKRGNNDERKGNFGKDKRPERRKRASKAGT